MANILIIDDEPDLCALLREILMRDGHIVTTASGREEALQLAARVRPDIVICDWMLQEELTGIGVLSLIRAIVPLVRPILISAFASDDLRSNAQLYGGVRFLEKPLELRTLRSAVEEEVSSFADGALG